ncbi:hypothetical protein GEMRC1_006037 [Eukaryota sp. GEM-RC1]
MLWPFLLVILFIFFRLLCYLCVHVYIHLRRPTLNIAPGSYALVTGASSGIGFQFAYELASAGYNLVIVGRDRSGLQEAAARLKHLNAQISIEVIVCDLSKFVNPSSGASLIISRCSHLDIRIVVNNAGYLLYGSFHNTSFYDDYSLLVTHVLSSLQLTKHFYKRLLDQNRGEGLFIFVSSICSQVTLPKGCTYSASKSLLDGFSKGFYWEARKNNIDVVCVRPGLTKTNFVTNMIGMPQRHYFYHIFKIFGSKPKLVVRVAFNAIKVPFTTCVDAGMTACLLGFCRIIVGSWIIDFVSGILGRSSSAFPDSMTDHQD